MKAIFFDWDGTLVDSLPLLFSAHNHVRAQMGLPLWTFEEYAKALVYSTRELYPKIYGERAIEAQDMLYKFIHENHLQELRLLEGSEELVTHLGELGVHMGIVSNKRDDVLKKEVEHLGWHKYFGVYNGAGVAKKDKPAGDPLIYALGLHPHAGKLKEIVYVGDTESDLSAATEAGWPVIFIQHKDGQDELIARYKPRHVVKNLAELKEKLIEFITGP